MIFAGCKRAQTEEAGPSSMLQVASSQPPAIQVTETLSGQSPPLVSPRQNHSPRQSLSQTTPKSPALRAPNIQTAFAAGSVGNETQDPQSQDDSDAAQLCRYVANMVSPKAALQFGPATTGQTNSGSGAFPPKRQVSQSQRVSRRSSAETNPGQHWGASASIVADTGPSPLWAPRDGPRRSFFGMPSAMIATSAELAPGRPFPSCTSPPMVSVPNPPSSNGLGTPQSFRSAVRALSVSMSPLRRHSQQQPSVPSPTQPMQVGSNMGLWGAPVSSTCATRHTSVIRAPSVPRELTEVYTPFPSNRAIEAASVSQVRDSTRRSIGGAVGSRCPPGINSSLGTANSAVPSSGPSLTTTAANPHNGASAKIAPAGVSQRCISGAPPPSALLVGSQGQTFGSIQLWTPRMQRQPRPLDQRVSQTEAEVGVAAATMPAAALMPSATSRRDPTQQREPTRDLAPRELSETVVKSAGRSPSVTVSLSPRSLTSVGTHGNQTHFVSSGQVHTVRSHTSKMFVDHG